MRTASSTRFGAARHGAVAAVAVLVAACGSATGEAPRPSSSGTYLPGLAAQVYLPDTGEDRGLPVVVLVPGGGWQSADPTGLRPLAAELAQQGIPAVTITYRAAGDGVLLPRSVADIRCATTFAAAETARRGRGPRPVVLLGHSSGAHLAAVASLGNARPQRCVTDGATVSDPGRVVGLVGLAGPYDIRRYAGEVAQLMGSAPSADPAAWREADPFELIDTAPADLRVLLLHGTADETVPSMMSRAWGDALRARGVDVTVRLVDGADHLSLFTSPVAAGPVVTWLKHS